MNPLLVPVDLLPGPLPHGAPRRSACRRCGGFDVRAFCSMCGDSGYDHYCNDGCQACGGSACLHLDLFPPPLVDGWPTDIDGVDVGAGMLARAMGADVTDGPSHRFGWHRPYKARSSARDFRLLLVSGCVGFADRERACPRDRWHCIPTLADIEPTDPMASRFAVAAALRAAPWKRK